MHKTILLFSRDPGGANVIIPLVEPLRRKGYNIRLFGKDHALKKYDEAGIASFNIIEHVHDIELKDIELFLTKEKPDCIITGTSGDDFTERFIWKSAEKLGILSFAILDQWINYGIRFSKYVLSELNKYKEDKTHRYLPSKILVMDEYAKQEAIKDGLMPAVIEVVGNPHFETLLHKKDTITKETINEIRNYLKVGSSGFLITFASEPVADDYDKEDSAQLYWGFTEKTIFKGLMEVLKIASGTTGREICVVLKLHPRENPNSFFALIDTYEADPIRVVISHKLDSHTLMAASDLICGMSSMFLIESIILDKPAISILIGLHRENPFVFDRRGILKSILNRNDLIQKLTTVILDNGDTAKCKFEFINNPIENIINLLEKNICLN
ncbi:MAG: hypothetical protein WA126_14105 [Thermodesulfovibrionales bacterium]